MYGGKEMQSLTFTPGRAFLSSDSTAVPWTVVFEDEGVTGYFYACDRSHERLEDSILDAMLIYNVSALTRDNVGSQELEKHADAPVQRIVSIQWSHDGLKAVLYLDGAAQALFDFGARCGFCRLNFPNFMADQGDVWNRSGHAWSDAAFEQFEAALYA
ncbi:MAG TPA: DUF2251 domain-containing protein [Acidobacteriaceae bacterium]|nr:DUF2251 domain-containing protein [Acidobacteriaceae bacterium]